MHRHLTWLLYLATLTLIALTGEALAQAVVFGRVILIDAVEDKGVEDARIVVYGANREELGSGLTKRDGSYSIAVMESVQPKMLEVRKNRHRSHPHLQQVRDPSRAQPIVPLSLVDAGPEYHRSVASALVDRNKMKSSEYQPAAYFSSAASLPPAERTEILRVLSELPTEPAAKEFARAIRLNETTNALEKELRAQGFSTINVVPDYKEFGTAVLFGSVQNQSDTRRLQTLIKMYEAKGVRAQSQVTSAP